MEKKKSEKKIPNTPGKKEGEFFGKNSKGAFFKEKKKFKGPKTTFFFFKNSKLNLKEKIKQFFLEVGIFFPSEFFFFGCGKEKIGQFAHLSCFAPFFFKQFGGVALFKFGGKNFPQI